jgi:D-glycerate 3-kinase
VSPERPPSNAAESLEAFVRSRLSEHRSAKPLVVGVCGSQGSGKSTACAHVAGSLSSSGIAAVVLSIDDLYLPRAARAALARLIHPLLLTRGVPGTHEVALGLRLFDALNSRQPVALPRFDKGLDDRAPVSRWPAIEATPAVVFFEGWCVGAKPQSARELRDPVNQLEAREDADGRWRRYVNDELAGAYQRLFGVIDLQVLLAAPSFEIVARWRIEQERNLRAARPGLAGTMSDEAVERFVQHYERLTRYILAEMPARAELVLRLDEQRRVVS